MTDRKTWTEFWVNRQKGPGADRLFEMARQHGDINFFLHLIYTYTKHRAFITDDFSCVVELGTRSGCSTCAFATAITEINQVLGKPANLYSVDIDPAPNEVTDIIRETGCTGYWEYIQGDDMEVVKGWRDPIDILFIDTSHEYDHTRAELESWVPLVKKGGLVLLHDTRSRHSGVMVPIQEYLAEHPGMFSFNDVPLISGLGILEIL